MKLCLLACCLAVAALPREARSAEHPNVLIILSDVLLVRLIFFVYPQGAG